MAQIGDVHPDVLVPRWHAARQLTPKETETIARLMNENTGAYFAECEHDIAGWLYALPPIPPRRRDRDAWERQLSNKDQMYWHSMEQNRQHVAALKTALRAGDLHKALRLLTRQFPVNEPDYMTELRPAWRRELQAIRDALEARIDDAIEQAVAAKAAG